MKRKRIIAIMLSTILIVTSVFGGISNNYAKTINVKSKSKKVTIVKGSSKVIKLTKTKKKVKWKITKGKSKIKIVKKSGKYKNKITIKAKKTGKAVIQAKVGKKAYKITVTIKAKKKKDTITQHLPEETVPAIETTKQQQPTSTEAESKETVNQYATVTFVRKGFGEDFTRQYKIGEPYGELPMLKIEDYAFGGWFTKYRGGKIVLEDDICIGDITLYAWINSLVGDIDVTSTLYIIDAPEENANK